MLRALASTLMGRAAAAQRLGKSFGGERNLYEALGYKRNLTFQDYYSRYARQDIARRIVEAPVDSTWRQKPEISQGDPETETPFEKAVADLVQQRQLWHYLKRLDRLSGIGEFGVMLLGFNDGAELDQPVQSATELLYLQPLLQHSVQIERYVIDTGDERYALPEMYKLKPNTDTMDATQPQLVRTDQRVHWTRVIHVAEGLEENDVFGTPRLKAVFNRLQDLELITGGSAEMFWRGAFPGLGFMAREGANFDPNQADDLEDEITSYIHGLRRYMKLKELDIEQLSAEVADPSNHVDMLVSIISSATGIPKRILMGSERGELASTQDKENWADRVEERRNDHATPRIVRPLIDRLMGVGVLPEAEDYDVMWPSVYTPNEKDQATVANTRTQALTAYSNAPGAEILMPPRQYFEFILGLEPEQIEQIMEAGEQAAAEEEAEIAEEERIRAELEEELARERETPPAPPAVE
jgi:hypothetical protein